MIELDEALERLEVVDPPKCRIVELRYFGGLTIEETAEALGVSPAKIKRDWSMARAWLRREISNEYTLPMRPERWRQVEALFHSALKREDGERVAFLAEASRGDESLRREVELLIASHEREGSFLDSPAYSGAAEQ